MSEKLKNLQSLAPGATGAGAAGCNPLRGTASVLTCATIVSLAVLAGGKPAAAEGPAGTAFTYQGDLEEGGRQLDGTANFEFSLWDDPTDTDPEAWLGQTLSKTV